MQSRAKSKRSVASGWSRRRLLQGLAAWPALGAGAQAASRPEAVGTRPVPSSGEALPLVGLGSWITFNVGDDAAARAECAEVMRAFFAAGGRLIDSSPMYGSSQSVIGDGLQRLGRVGEVFSADKVWTSSATEGPAQVEASRRHWRVPRFDLLQVHNLLGWQAHLPRLFEMKAAGLVRYVGVTTSHGRRHDDLEALMRSQPLDFVQLSYSPLDREPEARLLPLARERGIAVLVNRPFRRGALLDALQRRPVPGWAAELGCDGWAQAVLKFIVSHPAVTCAIPATTVPAHARQNLGAARGALPDEALRRRIAADVQSLA
jgi:diketogulonate reductase-like aldo/keto reductase